MYHSPFLRGRSSAGIERRPVTPEVAGSSPVGPANSLTPGAPEVASTKGGARPGRERVPAYIKVDIAAGAGLFQSARAPAVYSRLVTKPGKIVLLLVFAAVLLSVVGFVLFDAPLEYGLDCNRFSGVCTFTQRLMTRSRAAQARIDSLERAEVRVAPLGRSRTRVMVWVVSRDGSRFFAVYGSRGEAEADARRINAFLRDPSDGRLVLARSVRSTYWIAWALVPLVAAIVVALVGVSVSKKRAAPQEPDSSATR